MYPYPLLITFQSENYFTQITSGFLLLKRKWILNEFIIYECVHVLSKLGT